MNASSFQTSAVAQSVPAEISRENVAGTMVVLFALFGVFVVGMMLGGEHNEVWPLHPLWRVILTLAGLGVVGSYMRLMKLLNRRAVQS